MLIIGDKLVKKICILSSVNIKHMTLISLYTEKLIRDNISFDIIYMDKYGEEEEFPAENKYVFKNIVKTNEPKLVKVMKYFKFKNFAIPIIEKNNYDFIVVWSDNATFIFADYLAKNWKGKYSLNVRDYFHQNNIIVYKRFEKVINNSGFTTISSDAYKNFLPSFNYIHVHSLNLQLLKKLVPRKNLAPKDKPIRITFLGYVRFFEINKKLMRVFENDSRFQLHFYGTHATELKKYAEEMNILNTSFHDSFPVEDTINFIEKIDLINNLYGSGNMSVDYALSIKLYYGLYYKTPILVNSGTHMESIVREYDVGFVVNEINSEFKEELFNWYSNLVFEDFEKKCNVLLEKIEKDNSEFELAYQVHIKN